MFWEKGKRSNNKSLFISNFTSTVSVFFLCSCMYISHLNINCHNMYSFCKPVFSRQFRQISVLKLAFICEHEYSLILFVFLQHQFTRNMICACRDVALSCTVNARHFCVCVCLFYLMNKKFTRFWACLWELNFVIGNPSWFGEHGDQC